MFKKFKEDVNNSKITRFRLFATIINLSIFLVLVIGFIAGYLLGSTLQQDYCTNEIRYLNYLHEGELYNMTHLNMGYMAVETWDTRYGDSKKPINMNPVKIGEYDKNK